MKTLPKRINVTKPYLPPLAEVMPMLEDVWQRKWLTNEGPYHQKLEQELSEYMQVPYISLCSNGTLALLVALKVLDIKGEVITTPYSFVATSHSILWNDLTPVFADVETDSLTLDPEKIEELITPQTSAIMPVHVYGNCCQNDKIMKIAKKHNLKVIYDAAHAFGVKDHGIDIGNYGDLAVYSFHATKVFNTFEGGAIISHDAETKKKIDYYKNFGFEDETEVLECGINAKMNEFQAIVGLAQLKHIDYIISRRKAIAQKYVQRLKKVSGIRLLEPQLGVEHNYSYFPIFVEDNYRLSRDELYQKLKQSNIYTRRYFYPLITDFKQYATARNQQAILTNARARSAQVLCLPIYPDLSDEELERVCRGIEVE